MFAQTAEPEHLHLARRAVCAALSCLIHATVLWKMCERRSKRTAIYELLCEAGFHSFVESLCEEHYHKSMGRPGIPPGPYFRMLLMGYSEGIGSQRGLAWRCADSLSLRDFLAIALTE